MTVLRAQVSIPRDSLVPADVVVNTWHFANLGATTPAAAADAAHTQLEVFYQAIDANFAIYLGTPAIVKVYDLANSEPRVPIYEDTIALTTGSGSAFPAEVSACLSYRAAIVSGENPARRRGRIFLPPLVVGVAENSAADMRLTAAFRTAVCTAADTLAEGANAGLAGWVVFSPTSAGPGPWSSSTLDDSSWPVVAGYVDDAFDTVRSRGARTSARSTFTATLV